MSALKVIPWGDVIEATPGIVKGARKIFARTQHAEDAAHAPTEGGTAGLPARVAQLEASITELAEQQKASAKLIETLAEQNARIVEVVDLLRVRTRLLIGICVVQAAALAALVVWVAR